MFIHCPDNAGGIEKEIHTDEFVVELTEENFLSALESEDFESLAAFMKAKPELALSLYEAMKGNRASLAKDLTPYFTDVAHFTLDDQDIKTRLELAAVLPRTMAFFDAAMENMLSKLNADSKAKPSPLVLMPK